MDIRGAGWLAMLMLAACSGGSGESGDDAPAAAAGGLEGPFPKTVSGTIGYSLPVENGGGDIELGLLEYDNVQIIVSDSVYTAKGMDEDDAEVTLSLTPLPAGRCSDKAMQCFKGE
jgi:hypothetical protein